MALNLIRNARMFFTTNVNATTGAVLTSGFSDTNTWEIQVLDGLSFSQATGSETVTVNEAGDTPVRGQRQFNTSLEPAEITFSTYIRPYLDTTGGAIPVWSASMASYNGATLSNANPASNYGPNTFVVVEQPQTTGGRTAVIAPVFGSGGTANQVIGFTILDRGSGYTSLPDVQVIDPDATNETSPNVITITLSGALTSAGGSNTVLPEEYVLWEAFSTGLGASSGWSTSSSYGQVSFANSSKNQLKKFGMIIILDGSSYTIDNCVLDQATIDFGLDAISTIAWTARGSNLNSKTITATKASPVVFGGGQISGTAKAKNTSAVFLANKLSSVAITPIQRGGVYPDGTTTDPGPYTLALTGGSVTFANGVTYLTPANLGVVNKPATYFTGTRAISGSLNCYLKTDAAGSGELLADMLTGSSSTIEPSFSVTLHIGGAPTATTRVELSLASCVFTIPTINTEQVVSQTINFTAQGSTSNEYDLAATNEAVIKYYAV